MRTTRSRPPASATDIVPTGETPPLPAPRTLGQLRALLDAASRIAAAPGAIPRAARRDLNALLRSASRYKARRG